MKKKLLAVILGLTAAAALRAAWVYNAYLINQTVTGSQNFVLNLATTPNASGIARITAQAVYSSVTVPTDTFTDGRVSTATITVASNSGLVAAAAVDQITVASNATIQEAAATNSIVVNSTTGLTGAKITLNGTVLPNTWRVDVASDTAADISTEINLYVYQVIATVSGSTVTLTARTKGSAGNSYTLVSSAQAAVTATAATFSGGKDDAFRNQSITVNGMVYPRGYYWNQSTLGVPLTSTGTAVSLAALLNTISGIQANASGSVVYATATVAGVSGNAFTLSASTSALTVATPNFTGGASRGSVTINGTTVLVSTGASTTLTAAAIAAAINANSSLSPIVVATNTANVVFTTSTAVGTLSNYTLTTSTPTGLVPSHATYVGGLNSAVTIASPIINIAAHGYSTGAGVVFSTAGAPSLTPLVNGTTYFVIAVDANDLELATSLANAKAGTFITITSSSTTGPHTFTLTPSTTTGTFGLQWAVSNDCVNYTNLTTTTLGVAISSLTFVSPYTAAVTTWDLGPVNYQCLEAIVTGPTTGGVSMKLKLNGSNP